MGPNTFGQYRMMATLPQECWDELAKIFTKPASHDYKPPTALSHFTRIGNIPSEVLVILMKRITVDGWTTAQFQKACDKYKAETRIIKEILLLHQTVFRRDELMEWNDFQTEFPHISSKNNIDVFLNEVIRMKKKADKMPDTFTEQITAQLRKIKGQRERDEEIQSKIADVRYFVFFLIHFLKLFIFIE